MSVENLLLLLVENKQANRLTGAYFFQVKESGQNIFAGVLKLFASEIISLVNEVKQPGKYKVTFNGECLPSGVYFYRLTAGSFIQARKLVLQK